MTFVPMPLPPSIHPRHAAEEKLLAAFRGLRVDLGEDTMALGRALCKIIIGELETLSERPGFPVVIKGASFAAGSFGRKTHEAPLDDIDLYLVLNGCGLQVFQGEARWVLEGNATGPLSQDAALWRDGWCSADLVVARIAAWLPLLPTVQKHNAQCGLNTKRHSAYIKFAGGLNIDVSPVLWAVFTGAIDRYYMPLGNGSNFWKATNPKEDQRRISEINQQKGGLLLPSVRMLKWWNANMNAGRLKGIHLEVMAERAVAGRAVSGIAEALHLQFASIATQLDSACPDPTGLGDALDKNLRWEDRRASKAAAISAHDAVNMAGIYYTIDMPGSAHQQWATVFPGI